MKSTTQTNKTQRARHPMPPAIRQTLIEENLLKACQERPAYQRNDYLIRVTSAELETTRQKRIRQMPDAFAQGDRYMKITWKRR